MFQTLIQLAIDTVKLIKGKPHISDVIGFVVGHLPSVIQNAVDFGGYNTQEKIDDALTAFDNATGTDAGALAPFAGMPKEVQEQLFDHVKEIARIVAYNKIKVAGYYTE